MLIRYAVIALSVLLISSARLHAVGGLLGMACFDHYEAAGDSITAGSGVPAGYPLLINVSSKRVVVDDLGVGGSGMPNAPTTVIDNLVVTGSNCNVVASELYGYNDFAVGHSTSQFLSELASWADARRTAGVLVICSTLLPSQDASASGYNAWRDTVNTTLVTYAPGGGGTQHCDGLADYASDSIMGPDNSPTVNPTYWQGLGPHPTTLGQQRLAAVIQPVLLSLLH